MTSQPKPPLVVRSWRHLQRHGLKRTLRRVLDELRVPRGARLGEHAALPSANLPEIVPGAIYASLDNPLTEAVEPSSMLLLAGWACSRDGAVRIDTYVDGVASGAVRQGLSRPDVADFLPRVTGSGASGFSGEIAVRSLAYGTHLLEVVIEDQAGHRRVLKSVFHTVPPAELYEAYFESDLPDSREIKQLVQAADKRGGPPIHVWLDARSWDGAEELPLRATLGSIAGQSHPHWRCLVIAERSDHEAIAHIRDDAVSADSRSRFELVAPAALTGQAPTPGVYSTILTVGEVLSDEALLRLAVAAAKDQADLVYADHDTIDADGRHVRPWLNPDWSPDYLLGRDYVGGVYLFRDELRPELAPADEPPDPVWRFDLFLRLTDGSARVAHVPHILWSSPPTGDAAAGTAHEAELGHVRSALSRRGLAATADATDIAGLRRVTWSIEGEPLVSIVVPTTGNLAYVEPLTRSLARTGYPRYELVVIDNSRGRNPEGIELLRSRGARVIERDEDFNWAKLNNDGAREAKGELLLFLNDDIEIVDPDWLTELVAQASRPDVGVVGANLLYPDGRIQHGGVFFVDYGGGAMHLFQGIDPADGVYLDLHRVVREVSAVTGACLMVKRSLFEEQQGFNERLEIAGNDVDLGLRLMAKGYRNLWTPYCTLVHHESATRRDAIIVRDETAMWQLWGDFLRAGDPFHSPHFAKDRVDCALDARKLRVGPRAGTRHPWGVNLIGYIRAEMGVGQATRGTAAALLAADIPFTILDYQYGNPSRMADDTWAAHISAEAMYDVNVVYINADLVREAYPRLPAGTFDGRYTIGAWTWELPEFPDEWVTSFRHVDEVWVPSTFVQQGVALKSPVPVVRIPHIVEAPVGPFLPRAELGLPTHRFLFLMMYDYFSVRQRKNPEGAIEAFRRAFEATDPNVGLVIKMNNADRQERELVRSLAGEQTNVHLIDRTLSRQEVDSLFAAADCFVSLHRSEGFGLAIAEAMALGKPVIATDWSGNTDFMDHRNAACVAYELVELNQDYGPYRSGQLWAEPDLDDAARLMRELAGNPDSGKLLGERARLQVSATLSSRAVGRLINDRLGHLSARPPRR